MILSKSLTKPLLIVGPDNSVNNTFGLAKISAPTRRLEKLIVPTKDYYVFDLSGLEKYSPDEWRICSSTNEFYLNDVRRVFHELMIKRGFIEESVISPNAYIHESAIIGEGCIIHSGCSIDADVNIGKKTLLRPNTCIGEHTAIGDFVTLESNVSIREHAHIDSHTLVSANSSIARMVKIGKYCYLNQQKQYTESLQDYTSISSIFSNPVRAYI